MPVEIAEKPKGVIQKPSPAKERLVEELKKLQTHDPTVVPVRGGGYGKNITNQKRQLVKTQRLARLEEVPEPLPISATISLRR